MLNDACSGVVLDQSVINQETFDVREPAVRPVTDRSFAADVLGAERPVLVDFHAEWCGPCHALAPTLAQIAEENAGVVDVVKLDVDANPDVTNRFAIRGPADTDAVQGRPGRWRARWACCPRLASRPGSPTPSDLNPKLDRNR